MIVHYNGDDDGDGNICGDNRQKDEPCFHVLIHLDFVSHTHIQAKRCRWWSTGVGGHSKGKHSLFEIPTELPDAWCGPFWPTISVEKALNEQKVTGSEEDTEERCHRGWLSHALYLIYGFESNIQIQYVYSRTHIFAHMHTFIKLINYNNSFFLFILSFFYFYISTLFYTFLLFIE